jgi:hypothetical protein
MAAERILHTAHRWFTLLQLLVLGALTSCGGVDSGGTGASLSYGPINGLGSIIVNGVRYDDSNATVADEDGALLPRSRLQFGVTTSVEGSGVSGPPGDRRATAQRVRVLSELVGPVGAVDAAAQTFEVLRQAVRITPATVFGDGLSAGLAGLQAGMVVEVFAQFDSANSRYSATRIELRPDATAYVVRGKVGAVDTVARTFAIGALVIDYTQVSAGDASRVMVNELVRVRLQTVPDGAGNRLAISVSSGRRPIADADEAKVEGRISAFESTQRFSVDGVSVDATAARFPDGTAPIVLGARVGVEGSVRGGVVYAKEVHAEGDEDETNSTFEVHGTVEVLDAIARTMTVRGIAIDFSGNVNFENGTASDLRVGRSLEIEGVLQPGGVGLIARKISFEGR